MDTLWEKVKELEETDQAPKLTPTMPATMALIESDLHTHGCAYVIDTPQGFYMAHPNKVRVYGTPKIAGSLDAAY